jgi:hypothetical protein
MHQSNTPNTLSKWIFLLLVVSMAINVLALVLFLPGWMSVKMTFPDRYQPQSSRIPADIRLIHSDSTAVILSLGQSNAASSGQGSYSCRNEVYEFFNDTLYLASDPLLGDVGNGGCSVWTRVADRMIDSGLYQRVILIPVAIGATTIDCWAHGQCSKRLQERLEMITRNGISVTHVIWHQGESDNLENTSKVDYKCGLKEVIGRIRQAGVGAPFWVCLASYHPGMIGVKEQGIDTCIRQAQMEFIRETTGVRPGPDTDLLNLASDRHDGVHFSRTGLDKYALQLYLALRNEPHD